MGGVKLEEESALYKFVVKEGNGVKGLIECAGISCVPQPFVQPLSERIPTLTTPKANAAAARGSSCEEAIDLSQLEGPFHKEVSKQIVEAAQTLGFFQVVNHGVSAELLESLKRAAHEFFSQTPEKKAMYLQEVSPSRTVKYGTSFVPQKEDALEWKDYVSLLYTTDHEALQHWPPPCRDVALAFLKTSMEMVQKVVGVLMENVGVRLSEESRELEGLMGTKMLNMNYYPSCPSPELTVGVGRHSDMGLLTVLLQDEIGGLYVKVEDKNGENGEWAEIPPIPGALVINVGDTLEILSNGRYKSAEHRVRTTNTASRVSIPIFTAPHPSHIVGPFPQVVKRDGVARYKHFFFKDYMDNFFAQPHRGKNSLDFARLDYSPTFNFPQ